MNWQYGASSPILSRISLWIFFRLVGSVMGALFGVSDLKIALFGRAVILLNLIGQTVCHAQ